MPSRSLLCAYALPDLYITRTHKACFTILVNDVTESPELIQTLKKAVRADIGPFATPDHIIVTPALPKTRSGKIMRRVLRKIVAKVCTT